MLSLIISVMQHTIKDVIAFMTLYLFVNLVKSKIAEETI